MVVGQRQVELRIRINDFHFATSQKDYYIRTAVIRSQAQ